MFKKDHIIFYSLVITTVSILLYFGYHNEISEGGPDNIWHFYFSKYAIKYPDFFLHHWGKPVFIALTTGFAQFGFYGMKIFNILCGLASTIFVYKTLSHLNIKQPWIAAPILLFTPLYFIVLQSSLTEPLFSLILIISVYLFFTDRNILACILLSFLPFSRSEGMFMILCYAVYLIIIHKWKLLPLLSIGFVFYSSLGYFMGHDFLWYFTENPYNLNSPYGHGHFLDILKRYDNIWGLPFLIILSISTIGIIVLYFKQKQYIFWKSINETSKVLYLVVIPSLVFLFFHLYVWHFGLCGSAGLERVLASVIPLFALSTVWFINKTLYDYMSNTAVLSLIGVFLFFHIQTPFKNFSYPLMSWGAERCELDAAKWFETIVPEKCVIYYAHPSIIFNLERDPFDKNLNREEYAFNKDCSGNETLPTFFFWDSMFSENPCGITPNDVLKCGYREIKSFDDGGSFKLIVFEKIR